MLKTGVLFLLLAFSAAGCCGSDGGEARITSATLGGWSEGGFAVIGGFTSGQATLTTNKSDGTSESAAVSIGGPVVGIVFEVHGGGVDGLEDCGGASLTIPDGGVTEDELFQLYSGTGAQVGMAFGFSEHELENGAGVKLNAGGLTVGMGMFAGYEWFGMSRN